MAYFLKCDVKGCETTAECSFMGKPDGWTYVGFDADHDEAEVAMDAAGYTVGTARVERRVMMCPDHPLPEFDPEPESSLQSLRRMPRLS